MWKAGSGHGQVPSPGYFLSSQLRQTSRGGLWGHVAWAAEGQEPHRQHGERGQSTCLHLHTAHLQQACHHIRGPGRALSKGSENIDQ